MFSWPSRGVATGGISVYIPPKSVYLTNFYVVTGCFFSLTQDKFDIVPVCALARVSFTYLHTTIIYTLPQMKFLATPLLQRTHLSTLVVNRQQQVERRTRQRSDEMR